MRLGGQEEDGQGWEYGVCERCSRQDEERRDQLQSESHPPVSQGLSRVVEYRGGERPRPQAEIKVRRDQMLHSGLQNPVRIVAPEDAV